MADEDRVGGAAQNLAGKAKDAAGGVLGARAGARNTLAVGGPAAAVRRTA